LTTRHQQGTNSFPHRLKPSHIAQSRARQFGNSRIRADRTPLSAAASIYYYWLARARSDP
ncbi:MAG: hypothetical protein M1337_03375, partial [Actinobacteria bacterium]|nr:hypothetical protein [Actinomycetota bacterium]